MTEIQRFLDRTQGESEAAARSPASTGIPHEFIVWAYRLFLDREPENAQVVERFAHDLRTTGQVRRAFLSCEEYREHNPGDMTSAPVAARGAGKSMRVERIDDPTRLAEFFLHVQETWAIVGKTEPHWSVLSTDRFRQANLPAHLQEFLDSGRTEVDRLFQVLAARNIDLNRHATCLEYGCGVGRVTRWLADRFRKVHAFDISPPHLSIARKYVETAAVGNVEFSHVVSIGDLDRLPAVDFFYCIIVLQHNPPPVIEHTISRLARALRPGGVGVFQVPTYRAGYAFAVEPYLKSLRAPGARRDIEMHVLPIDRVHRVVFEAGCVPLDVIADAWAGPDQSSSTFLIHRPGA